MKKAWSLTGLTLLAVVLMAPSSVAAPSPPAAPVGGGQEELLSPAAVATHTIYSVQVCYAVSSATGGWGSTKCDSSDNYGPAPEAGCPGCVLEFITVDPTYNVTFRIRAQNGWGEWKNSDSTDNKAGCSSCRIEALQLYDQHIPQRQFTQYRVRTASGFGEWRSEAETAGCIGCAVEAIQLRIFSVTAPI